MSILPFDCTSSLVFLGSVSAQFSHGIALFLSFSSYVFRKLESRLWFERCPPCNTATLGLSGGVSIADCVVWDLEAWLCSAARCAPFDRSEELELVLLPLLTMPASPSEGFRDRELVLGRRVLRVSSSKHDVHPTGNPSVTINGVGP